MPTYVALLRAINLGPRRRVAMGDLRDWLTEAGYADVVTHLATGNVRLGSSVRTPARVEAALEALLAERAGFEVPTLVYPAGELRAVAAEVAELPAPLLGDDVGRHVLFLRRAPDPQLAADLDARDSDGGALRVSGRVIHVWLRGGVAEDRAGAAKLEREVGPTTMRTGRVVTHLAERWC